jgi:hypothetical protein
VKALLRRVMTKGSGKGKTKGWRPRAPHDDRPRL